MKSIDLNCDVGEELNNEAELLPYISSCNIACGRHAGDDDTIKKVIDLALEHHVAIGAHPSFDDRENFGRRPMLVMPAELRLLVSEQVQKLKQFCESGGTRLQHVKPHGALYNQMASSKDMSSWVIDGILDVDQNLSLVGLADSETMEAAKGRISFVAEGFADRKYLLQNQLMPRKDGGLMTDLASIQRQIAELLLGHEISTTVGVQPLKVDTICLHGDTEGATDMIPSIHQTIMDLGFKITGRS